MLIRIEGVDLPGRTCGPGPDYPDGHHNIHVAVQGKKGQQDLFGLTPGDAQSVVWDLEATVVARSPEIDVRGPQIQGPPGKRFIYLTWGVVGEDGSFRMFRRAKLWLHAIPPEVLAKACDHGLVVGRVGLTDEKGWPRCGTVRRGDDEWSAPTVAG